ncbi:MAG: urate hydroxylase PuuD [Gammaproteobacteria bacterium]
MSAYLFDWLSLLTRWFHFITGIAWIGSSFYFVWLDNHLLPPADAGHARKGVGGELWSVHGGGFYHAQKYRVAPETLPKTLHWFYWEAYSTFLSGFVLLTLLYFGQAEVYLIDPAVAPLSKPAAIAIGLAFIVGGWFIYDGLCRTKLAKNGAALGGVLAVLLTIAAFALCHLFSGRGAFIEFGAMLGTIMVANVFFVIIPGQREMVRAKLESREPDPGPGLRGKVRSTHNTYFTLPVLFTMISNHYAMTYGARFNWLVLVALSAAGALIRVYFVSRHKAHERGGRTSPIPVALGILIIAGVAAALAPARGPAAGAVAESPAVQFQRVQSIVSQRCAVCHTAIPSQGGFSAPPSGVRLDKPDQILLHTAKMQQQLAARTMPVGNVTGLTEPERAELLAWIARGSPH